MPGVRGANQYTHAPTAGASGARVDRTPPSTVQEHDASAVAWAFDPERETWEAHGVHSFDEAEEWKSFEFTPEEAFEWGRTYTFSSGDAGAWHSKGFSPSAAHAWASRAVGVSEARDWVAHGFLIGLADIERGRGVTADESVEQWAAIGMDPTTSTNDSDPGATSWIRGEFSPDQAQAWRAIGVVEPSEAGKWRDFACLDPDTAQPWISRGLKLADYRRWYAAGVTDPEVVQTWRDAVHADEDFDDSDDFRITMMKRYGEPDAVPYDSR